VVTAVNLAVRKAVAIAAATAEEDLAAHHPAGAIVAEEARPHQTAMDATTVNLLDAGWRPAFSPRSPSGGFARSLLLSCRW